ncbi:MAG: site-specific integrase, partial [Candidatus Binatia bacterium]
MNLANESLSGFIDAFLAMVTVEKGLAKNTIEAYGRDLAGLAEYLLSNGISRWQEVDPTLVRSYVSALRQQGLSARSITRHIV